MTEDMGEGKEATRDPDNDLHKRDLTSIKNTANHTAAIANAAMRKTGRV